MNWLDTVDGETALSGTADWLGPDAREALAAFPLESVETEYPHYTHSVEDSDGPEPPSERHPVFYGCFDWHSAVHSHWCLVRQLRLFDDHPDEAEIVDRLDRRLTAENVAGEVTYVEANESFERPYGWGWLLRLAAELHLWDDARATRWREALDPLETLLRDRVRDDVLTQDRAFRVGTHGNTAFALAGVLDYARVVSDETLEAATEETTRRLFLDDTDYPVEYEPLGWDFLSPALTEADLVRRVLDADAFGDWLDHFLPDVRESPYDSLLDPVDVETDDADGAALHLVGLNLSKAWCLAGVAETLEDHPYAAPLEASARRHVEHGLEPAFTGDYAGSHWLSSFVLYLLTRREGGIAPSAAT